ncbi:M48 family metallopeptidase [[Clostridium] dakarense]|uniref:M48 family metallopeptidase n=1 Tax=Faecalimicrobium dakarense TaxID=1301100 RepID=UPI002418AD01|nr:SprT family zinc-dependent metalloprotease [[Clostridium] dakarense]
MKIKYPGIVEILSPSYVPDKEIQNLVLSKANWIFNKLKEFEDKKIEEVDLSFEDNSNLPFLGENHILNIIRSSNIINCKFEFDKNKFIAYVPTFMSLDKQNKELKRLFIDWLIWYGTAIVNERINIYSKELNVSFKSFKVKEQKSTWGTCSSLGNIYINYKILLAPIDIVDYVVVHELCHLREMNHSNKFWSLVQSIIPDYIIKRNWLKENGFKLKV